MAMSRFCSQIKCWTLAILHGKYRTIFLSAARTVKNMGEDQQLLYEFMPLPGRERSSNSNLTLWSIAGASFLVSGGQDSARVDSGAKWDMHVC
jgi:hypothetical protein